MRGHLTALFLILLAAPVAAECAPTYRAAESRIERRVSAAAHVGFSTILIGCEADLRSLTDEEIVAVVRYEREVIAGEELPETVTLGDLDVLINAEGEEVFLFDTAGTLVDAEGTPILDDNGWLLPEFADYVVEALQDPELEARWRSYQ